MPPGDVLLAIVSDEEMGGRCGARFLVEQHPEQFAGIRYALGELGGFTQWMGGHRFYPIMVAEKRVCVIEATVSGRARHALLATLHGETAARLGTLLRRLDRARPPARVNPVVRQMITTAAQQLPAPDGPVMRLLTHPALVNPVLGLLGARGAALYPLLHNVVNVTAVQGGEQIGITPARLTATLMCSLLPDQSLEGWTEHLQQVLGEDVELNVVYPGEAGPPEPDMALYPTLCEILREGDPGGTPMPLLGTAATDGRHFAQLGIQTYGFQPLRLPPSIDMASLSHAPDERVPADALEFGTAAIVKALQRFGAGT